MTVSKRAGAGGPRSPGPDPRRPWYRGFAGQVLIAGLLALLISVFVARIYMIPSGSMEATLHGCDGCQNDRVLVDKLVYDFRQPTPGEVIVFAAPVSWVDIPNDGSSNTIAKSLHTLGASLGIAEPRDTELIKRVIAVGGQTVACCDAKNRVTVDGHPLTEPYISFTPDDPEQAPFDPVTLRKGELWVMGDNRNNSLDSRAPGHGPVLNENVIGKPRMITMPFARFGGIDDRNPQDREGVIS